MSGLILHSEPSWKSAYAYSVAVLREGDVALVISAVNDDDDNTWYCLMGQHGIGWATDVHILDVDVFADHLSNVWAARKRWYASV